LLLKIRGIQRERSSKGSAILRVYAVEMVLSIVCQ